MEQRKLMSMSRKVQTLLKAKTTLTEVASGWEPFACIMPYSYYWDFCDVPAYRDCMGTILVFSDMYIIIIKLKWYLHF
jgi:hypothetical protein